MLLPRKVSQYFKTSCSRVGEMSLVEANKTFLSYLHLEQCEDVFAWDFIACNRLNVGTLIGIAVTREIQVSHCASAFYLLTISPFLFRNKVDLSR